jgi:hypothetical protein
LANASRAGWPSPFEGSFAVTSGKNAPFGNCFAASITRNAVSISPALNGSNGLTSAAELDAPAVLVGLSEREAVILAAWRGRR